MNGWAELPLDGNGGLRQVSTLGVAALVLTKATDLVSTAIGLHFVGGVTERNPIANAIVQRFGIPGLLGTSIVGVVVVVLVVEWMVTIVEKEDVQGISPTALYLISYAPLSLLYALATIHNTLIVLSIVG